MIQKDQNFEIWVTFEVAQKFWGYPKINSVPLGPVTEPKGFKLDMHGPEGSIYPLLRAWHFLGFKPKEWL